MNLKSSRSTTPGFHLPKAENIFGGETYQVYLDIMGELQEEGKERMADEVIRKLISRMSPERAEKLLLVMPEGLKRKWQVEANAENVIPAFADQIWHVVTKSCRSPSEN